MNLIDITFLSPRDIWMLSTVFLCALFILDDVMIDILSFMTGRKPREITPTELKEIRQLTEKKFAIIVANWKEEDVLEQMVSGNIQAIEYKNYDFILGVYPNDSATIEAAQKVSARYKNVKIMTNHLNGPTSKGQLLNKIVADLVAKQKTDSSVHYDAILIQDAEDIIHPFALKLLNARLENYDFIQIPVFSLPIPKRKLTAGVYADEFIESHTKDLLVRDIKDAGIPSAGVGTAIKLNVVEQLMLLQNGRFLNEKTLTEDYHLGLTCHDLSFKSHFSCEYYKVLDQETQKETFEYVATREYFPQKVRQSVRQKTRWAVGISLQGFQVLNLKRKHFFKNYFLWRDRKNLIGAPLFTSSVIFTVYFLVIYFTEGHWPQLDHTPYNKIFTAFMWLNLLLSLFRIVQRFTLVQKIYGLKFAMLVPIRWVLSNFINTASTYNAIFKWSKSQITGKELGWVKTSHIVPEGFGTKKGSSKDE